MKKVIQVLTVLSLFLLVACGGSAPVNESEMPDFVLNPPIEKGILFGTGIAKKASPQLAKEVSDLRAKKEIAKILGQKISNLMKDFLGETGIGKGAEITEFTQSVTKAVTEVELVGVTIVRREFINGTTYSLAKYALDGAMRKLINKQVEKSFSNRQALLSEFRAKQGFAELDKELKKLESNQP